MVKTACFCLFVRSAFGSTKVEMESKKLVNQDVVDLLVVATDD